MWRRQEPHHAVRGRVASPRSAGLLCSAVLDRWRIHMARSAITALISCLWLCFGCGGSPARAEPAAGGADLKDSVCLMIEAAARAHDLPLEFFARVIWQESRFRPDAVGPRTRSGDSAQGIAQFMPRTAAERGLLDPFDPVQALPKSAQFLQELRGEFGNLGLAAAAYNAGPARVRGWLAGTRTLPSETRRYVAAITGISVD